ncbi:MAG: hypothetical protein M1832_001002 [Thelocarpon impressellum]|nr:MAG: hypothetical protein M1832_001002 [Thelocarpon impressellum]
MHMPTFWSLGTAVHLSISRPPLASGTTSTRNSSAGITFTNSARPAGFVEDVLPEETLSDAEEAGHLDFLGEHRETPFLMVRAGGNVFQRNVGDWGKQRVRSRPSLLGATVLRPSGTTGAPSTPTSSNSGAEAQENEPAAGTHSTFGRLIRRPPSPTAFSTQSQRSSTGSMPTETRLSAGKPSHLRSCASESSPPLTPRPLSLKVLLSKASFLPTSDRAGGSQDIQVVVFLNGEFTAARLVSTRTIKGTVKAEDLRQTFTGRRVDRMLEQNWVLVPPGQNADGSLRPLNRSKGPYAGAGERWGHVAEALEAEADQWGRDGGDGELSTMGQYLTSLARLSMPEAVEGLQRGGGQKFGVVDVVLLLGLGKKDPPSKQYLRGPKRYLDPRYSEASTNESTVKTVEDVVLRPKPANFAKPTFASTQRTTRNAPKAGSAPVPPTRSPLKPRPSRSRRRDEMFPATLGGAIAASGPLGQAFDLNFLPAGASFPKPRHPTSIVAAVQDAAEAQPQAPAQAQAGRAGGGPVPDSGSRKRHASPAPDHPTPQQQQQQQQLQPPDSAPPQPQRSQRKRQRRTLSPARASAPPTPPPPPPSAQPAHLPAPPQAPSTPSGTAPAATAPWAPSALCADSFVTYAPRAAAVDAPSLLAPPAAASLSDAPLAPGAAPEGTRGGGWGAFTPVRSERGGVFAERDAGAVLLGVRFVVG